MKHFLIYTNKHKDKQLEITNRVCSYLEKRGQKVTLRIKETDWKHGADNSVTWNFSQDNSTTWNFPVDADCMIVLGGDGTVLQAVRETQKHQFPIIGINLGTLGYMTELEPSNLEDGLERLIAGEYHQVSRMMLKGVGYHPDGRTEEGWALNDIVISKINSLQLIKFIIRVNGQFLHEYSADGMIVTTPTGSTGYNLSAGGPLVEPEARLMVLTPICPHTLIQRSIVLSSEDVIEIEIPLGKEGMPQTVAASFDGSHNILLQTGDCIRVGKSEENAEFIQLNQVSFLEVLHKKMGEA